MSKHVLPALVALALGLAAGFGVSALRTPGPRGDESAGSPERAASGSVGERARVILAGSDPARRLVDLSGLLASAGSDALPSLLEAIDASALDGGDPELGLFGMWWAEFDPEAAYQWTRTDWRAQFGSVIAGVFHGWARRDPERALEQASQLRFPFQRQLALEAVLSGWDESGRPGLIEAAQKLASGTDSKIVAVLARRRVGALGPEGAIRWVESLEDASFRESMTLAVAIAGASIQGGSAVIAKWVEPRITGADHRTRFPIQIGTQWVRHDPEAAMAWLAALPLGVDRDDGVAGSFEAWMARDGVAAFAWAEQLELERWNEPAFAVYARGTVVYGRAEKSLPVVARFSNPLLRDSTTLAIAEAWLDNDRPAALAWFAQADLPEDIRRQVVAMAQPQRGQPMRAGAAPPNPQAQAQPQVPAR